MAKQTINLGTAPTGTGGDTPRSAFQKVNENFDELYIGDAENYKKSNIIGTVSQLAGVPTGAIIEYGTNANGRYIKYADGTMVCWYYSSASYAIDNPTDSGVFYSIGLHLYFPVPFASEVPVVIPAAISGNNYFSWGSTEAHNANVSYTILSLVSPSSTASSYVSYIAIGRWK
jgi:hypothetical protein